ncbi:hypothetical protein KOR34_08340 [Posidoniimonas corsicana]|uniref:Ice-binding protein C-terminal domain-containing protein n=1 Tax=Posidoniimonas corsicana TaxID=1938618 RepID=A0A5C5VDA2_9BACT|nr:PEP-CTERM sorting domain-containing protein [Posidoniimonas corsicana]TWT35937.1 hypothetical protein KOR34_08340 [Posidoniimonas corsicana]
MLCRLSVLTAAFAALAAPASAAVNFVGVPSSAASGDYNADGVVDAADYTVWRDNLGGGAALPNDGGLGAPIGQGHYDLWQSNYGSTGGGGNTFAFEDPANWDANEYDPVPVAGPETEPPGPDSIWFAEGNSEDVVLVLNDERSGENGTLAMGTFAFGGDNSADANANFTLVLNASVTLNSQERDGTTGEPREMGVRPIRLGRENVNPLGTLAGGTTETAPWGILLHQAGTLKYADGVSGSIDMSRDKPNSAGAIYEISGNAVLELSGSVRFGDRDNGGSRTTPGGIFRVRGSNAALDVEDYINESRLGLWDHDNDVTTDNPNGVTKMNLGKFVTEFVLDGNGASPISVRDELRLGRSEVLDGNTEIGYAFLRLKLSEPTAAGTGAVGSGDEIVLFRADRLSSAIDLGNPENEIEQGRFFDPDRAGLNSSGTSMLPHAGMWEGGTVLADYAGAQYAWTINYFDSSDDGELVDAVTLSNLVVTGTPGDLSMNGSLGAEDRQLLVDAIAAPPQIAIATAQNLFDLNADEVVDSLDLAVFDTHFPLSSLAAGQAPEPTSLAIAALAAVGVASRRRR